MATLTEIFGNIKEDCYIDESGVYLDGKKVAINNKSNSAYTRRNGERTYTKIGNSVYSVSKPMRLVAAAPGADPDLFERAVINALDACGYEISATTTDKLEIAREERISTDDLTKFKNVALVGVDYFINTTELNSVDCDINLC